jgi:hypothetical protein
VQHSTENRNPYAQLVANVHELPLIHVAAYGKKSPDSSDQLRRLPGRESFTSSSKLPTPKRELDVTLPALFQLAASRTCLAIGGENAMISLRATVAGQITMPHAPKPPTIKLKNGKGGMSTGVIPTDLDTTMDLNDQGQLCRIVQKEELKPKDSAELTTIQLTKPLEQIVLGLQKDPPEFVLHNKNSIQTSGYLEVKHASDDDQHVYRIQLASADNNVISPVMEDVLRKTTAEQPTWWDSTLFGDFSTQAKCGYPVEYKNPADSRYEPYECYARLLPNGQKLMISGDQDIFWIPRSEKYQGILGDLETRVIDTKSPGGTDDLMSSVRKVFKEILIKDVTTFRRTHDDEQVNQYLKDKSYEFEKCKESLATYAESLGHVTPYEAYFIMRLNREYDLLVTELHNKILNNADLSTLVQEVDTVNVQSSLGIQGIERQMGIKGKLDVDLHAAWFSQEPEEIPFHCAKRVEYQLAHHRHVAPDVLFAYMDYLALKQPDDLAQFARERSSNLPEIGQSYSATASLPRHVREHWNNLSSEYAIFERIEVQGKIKINRIDSSTPLSHNARDVLIVDKDGDDRKKIIHLKDNQVVCNDMTAHVDDITEKWGIKLSQTPSRTYRPS